MPFKLGKKQHLSLETNLAQFLQVQIEILGRSNSPSEIRTYSNSQGIPSRIWAEGDNTHIWELIQNIYRSGQIREGKKSDFLCQKIPNQNLHATILFVKTPLWFDLGKWGAWLLRPRRLLLLWLEVDIAGYDFVSVLPSATGAASCVGTISPWRS